MENGQGVSGRRKPNSVNCYDCGAPCGRVPSCPVCGSQRLTTTGRCRPRLVPPAAAMDLPGPWKLLHAWPEGCSVSISGGPGVGKSSLCALFHGLWRMTWCTAEESGAQAGRMFRRIYPDREPPDVYTTSTPGAVREVLAAVTEGLVVLDSATAVAGWERQVELLEHVDDWLLDGPNRRFLAILQVNGQGEAAGRMEVTHLVDACCHVDDDHGFSRLSAWKNRNGPVGSAIFELTAQGPRTPELPYAYSVEGSRGRYYLLPYPMPGGRYHGYLHALMKGREDPIHGVATAAIPVPAYDRGLFFPADVAARRAFAEAHGLTWWPADGESWYPPDPEEGDT